MHVSIRTKRLLLFAGTSLVFLAPFILPIWPSRLRASLGLPNTTTNIRDGSSTLLIFLVQPEDFPDDFKWFEIDTLQEFNVPASNNNNISETAGKTLYGYYKEGTVIYTSAVFRYESVLDFEKHKSQSGDFFNTPKNFIPQVATLFENQDALCKVFDGRETSCVVVFEIDGVFVWNRLNIYVSVEPSVMENIIEHILVALKNRIP